MNFDFRDKVMVVTGGSSGIGKVTASFFSDCNAKVYNLDLEGENPCDISHYGQVKAAFEAIWQKEGRIDFVFANAGQYLCANLVNTSLSDLDRVIDVNLKGTIYTLQCVLPLMQMQQYGTIVLMGSDQSFIAKEECAIYGATKSAIAHLAKSTALDYARYNIRINCICPGTIETPLYHQIVDTFSKKSGVAKGEVHQKFLSEYPTNSIGQPEEIARLVAFLCSGQTPFMTGSSIAVDGGYTAK